MARDLGKLCQFFLKAQKCHTVKYPKRFFSLMLFPLAYKKDSRKEPRGGITDPAMQRQLSAVAFLLLSIQICVLFL